MLDPIGTQSLSKSYTCSRTQAYYWNHVRLQKLEKILDFSFWIFIDLTFFNYLWRNKKLAYLWYYVYILNTLTLLRLTFLTLWNVVIRIIEFSCQHHIIIYKNSFNWHLVQAEKWVSIFVLNYSGGYILGLMNGYMYQIIKQTGKWVSTYILVSIVFLKLTFLCNLKASCLDQFPNYQK